MTWRSKVYNLSVWKLKIQECITFLFWNWTPNMLYSDHILTILICGLFCKNKSCCFGNSVLNASPIIWIFMLLAMLIIIILIDTKQLNSVERNNFNQHKCHISIKDCTKMLHKSCSYFMHILHCTISKTE